MICGEALRDYALRSLGYGERLLPREDITLCEQVVLIGSGMIWNIYFGILALAAGFVIAVALGTGKTASNPLIRKPADWIVLLFRGSPLFIQFFFAYFAFLSLGRHAELLGPLSAAWLGALIVLILNTAAYAGEIFHGALRAIPRGELEAADAYGLTGWTRFRRITFPTMLRLAWPAYTNEAIFLFHATTLVFFSGFPARQRQGDALYYANYLATRTFNPFVPYPILALYFIALSLTVIGLFALMQRHLSRHLPRSGRPRFRLRPNLIR